MVTSLRLGSAKAETAISARLAKSLSVTGRINHLNDRNERGENALPNGLELSRLASPRLVSR